MCFFLLCCLAKVFSIKTLKVFMIHVKAILVGVDHIRIFGIGLELVCNGGSCQGIKKG